MICRDAREHMELADAAQGDLVAAKLRYGQFLDDFRNAPDALKEELISKEPAWPDPERPSGPLGPWYYYLACTAEQLAQDNGITVPSWCVKRQYYPARPLYAMGTADPEFRRYLEDNTYPAFAARGVYAGCNLMERR